MITKHIGYLERIFGYRDRMEVSGDMGWSFSDLSDSFTEDIDKLREGSEEYCFSDAAVWGDDVMDDDGSFAIYEIREADLELDDDTGPLWSGTIVQDTSKLVEVHVCATKEQAVWIEEDSHYKDENVKFKYRAK